MKKAICILLLGTLIVATQSHRATKAYHLIGSPDEPIQVVPEPEPVKDIRQFEISFYCACYECSEGWGMQTASGKKATQGRTIAAPKDFPFGTKIILGGHTFTVEDRGGYIKYNPQGIARLDIYLTSHKRGNQLGRFIMEGEVLDDNK